MFSSEIDTEYSSFTAKLIMNALMVMKTRIKIFER